MSMLRRNGPVPVRPKPRARRETPETKACSCNDCFDCFTYGGKNHTTPKVDPKAPIKIFVCSAFDPDGMSYKVKRDTVFKRLSDDYHDRKNLHRGTVTFYCNSREIPWNFVGDFDEILNDQPFKTGSIGWDYMLEARML